jgi:hypothetical protein
MKSEQYDEINVLKQTLAYLCTKNGTPIKFSCLWLLCIFSMVSFHHIQLFYLFNIKERRKLFMFQNFSIVCISSIVKLNAKEAEFSSIYSKYVNTSLLQLCLQSVECLLNFLHLPGVCLYAWNNSRTAERMLIKFYTTDSQNFVKK